MIVDGDGPREDVKDAVGGISGLKERMGGKGTGCDDSANFGIIDVLKKGWKDEDEREEQALITKWMYLD
jgi:hypothetical protein